jgi:hypothetical protein
MLKQVNKMQQLIKDKKFTCNDFQEILEDLYTEEQLFIAEALRGTPEGDVYEESMFMEVVKHVTKDN